MLEEEKFSVWSHVFGAFSSFFGLIALIITYWQNATAVILSFIYGLSAIFIFSASSVCHKNKHKENETILWRKIDHIAIFFMIAGSYTPFAYVFFKGYLKWLIIGLQWGLVAIGSIVKLFFINIPKWAHALIYLLMGWMIVFPINQLIAIAPTDIFSLTVLGGIVYSVGTVFYSSRRDTLFSTKIRTHDIFHVCILVAALLHYIGIFRSLALMI